MPFLVSTFGVLLSVISTLIYGHVKSIRVCVTRLSAQVTAHVTAAHLHEAAVARFDEQIKGVHLADSIEHKALHDRIDMVKEMAKA